MFVLFFPLTIARLQYISLEPVYTFHFCTFFNQSMSIFAIVWASLQYIYCLHLLEPVYIYLLFTLNWDSLCRFALTYLSQSKSIFALTWAHQFQFLHLLEPVYVYFCAYLRQSMSIFAFTRASLCLFLHLLETVYVYSYT